MYTVSAQNEIKIGVSGRFIDVVHMLHFRFNYNDFDTNQKFLIGI